MFIIQIKDKKEESVIQKKERTEALWRFQEMLVLSMIF